MKMLVRRIRLSVSVSALLTFIFGILLTIIIFIILRSAEVDRHQQQFQQNARLRGTAIQTGMSDAVEQLMVLNQLFRSIGSISREQFHTFTTPILHRYPEIQALSFDRRDPIERQGDPKAVSQRAVTGETGNKQKDGQRQSVAWHPETSVVDLIEPTAGNQAVLGLRLPDNIERDSARLHARRTGLATATGLFSLVQAPGWHSGFLVLVPLYRGGAVPDSTAERERLAIGETAAVFRVDHLIDTILQSRGFGQLPGIHISLYSGKRADPAQLAFRQGDTTPTDWLPQLPGAWLFYDVLPAWHATFALAGKDWYIEVVQSGSWFVANNQGALYVLIGGLLASLLAAAYVYTLVSRIYAIELDSEHRTARLQSVNRRLTEDLTQRMHNEKSLRLRERIIEISANAIMLCSAEAPDYLIEYVNPAFVRITGFSAADVVGRSLESLEGNGQDQLNMEEIRAALRERREGHALLRNYRKDGSGYWNELFVAPVQDEQGLISHFVVAQYDISTLVQYEAELEFQAHHDALTGLANRHLLRKKINEAINAARLSGLELWVVFVDLDRFKFVNDTLGHEAGDGLLRTLASRLRSTTQEADTVARLGGDEFVLLLPNQQDTQAGQAGTVVLQSIMDSIAEPLVLQEHEFFLTCSMGIAVFPGDGETAESLIKHADIAMYRAKEMGRNNFQFYTPTMIARTLDRLSIEADLRHALTRNEFVLHYQPQIDLKSGLIVGMEALLRWQHPVHGPIAPGRFIALAEEMGLIVPIGAWALRAACIQTRQWQLAGFDQLRVAVNLSARQFTQKGLAQVIAGVLDETGLAPGFLELELTESMVMNDVESAVLILRSLKELGVHIAIDDFGTGYSSLSYLRRFPLDVLKIDQSFVCDLATNADAAAIVVAVISLAHSLRLQVIAEGVETIDQIRFLRSYGCDQMQGYYFSRPVAADKFEALLRNSHSPLGNTDV